MKKMSGVVVVLLATLVSAVHANLEIKVKPEGDGQSGRARYGSFHVWESTGFTADASPNWSGHWYESSWYSGESSDVFMQISLAAIPVGTIIEKAELVLHILECSGNGGQIYHRSNSSTATGLASQQLAGDVKITDITGAAPGWWSIDITSYIQSDLDKGHSWAVFSFPNKGYSSLQFSSGETNQAAYLAVVIPEPATMGILGFGSLFLFKRRK